MNKIIFILLLSLLAVFNLMAQNDSVPFLNSDRPAQSESPFLMHKGFFQIETGAQYVHRTDKEKDVRAYQAGYNDSPIRSLPEF